MILSLPAAFWLDPVVTGACYLPVHDGRWQVARWISKYGDWPPILCAGLAVVAGLVLGREHAAGRFVLLVLVAGLLTGLAANVVRCTAGRTRPSAPVPQGFYGLRYEGKWIIGKYNFSSFPSGHTAVWAGLAGAAWARRRSLAAALLLGGAAVAWSRMALGCHHFSDVTASFIWGLAVGPWLVNRLAQPIDILWSRLRLPGK